MKKIVFLFGTLLVSTSVFASSGEEIKTEKEVILVEQVCCSQTAFYPYLDSEGNPQFASGSGTYCVTATNNPVADTDEACGIALGIAKSNARRNALRLSEEP